MTPNAQEISRNETAAYNDMMTAWNNWTLIGSVEQKAAYEQARDKWEDLRQALIKENLGQFTAQF